MVKGSARVTFLGTGASSPTKNRWLPGILVRIRNEFLLLDCGEGVQYRILTAGLRVNKLSAILITHLHGDHVYGLPGLLESLNNWGRIKPLTVVGPQDLLAFLESLRLRGKLNYEIVFVSARDKLAFRGEGYTVKAVAVMHGLEAYGYVIVEDPLPGEFNAARAEALGIPPGPERTRLVQGYPVTLPNGRVVHPSEVVSPSRRGLKIVYSGDTTPCTTLVEAARDADLLIHEATFSSGHVNEAENSFHSTSVDAAQTAQKASVKFLFLTHFSNRYSEGDLSQLLSEARSIFKETFLARDLLQLELRRLYMNGLTIWFNNLS
ncbi:MAG: ribonuclease Z [Thermofilaceae archaeon]